MIPAAVEHSLHVFTFCTEEKVGKKTTLAKAKKKEKSIFVLFDSFAIIKKLQRKKEKYDHIFTGKLNRYLKQPKPQSKPSLVFVWKTLQWDDANVNMSENLKRKTRLFLSLFDAASTAAGPMCLLAIPASSRCEDLGSAGPIFFVALFVLKYRLNAE